MVASYQVSIHLAKRFQRRRFFYLEINQSETIIAWGWPCLLSDLDEMSNLYRGPSIDASVHLAKVFQRRRLKYEKLTDDRRQVMTKAHIAFGKVN